MRAVVGNGRKTAIEHAYKIGAAQAKYRTPLLTNAKSLGIDVVPQAIDSMSAPMLVRIMDESDVSDNLGAVSNAKAGLDQSDVERATNDVRSFDFGSMEFDERGEPTPESVAKFIASLPKNEVGNLVTHDGHITPQAIQRFMAATFKYAYEDDALVGEVTMETYPNAKRVLDAAMAASGVMAALKGMGEFDVSLAVADAIGLAINAKRQGFELANMAQNQDIAISDEGRAVAQMLGNPAVSGSSKRMAEALRRWGMLALQNARIAEENQRQGGLLGPAPTLSRADIFAALGSDSNPTDQAVTGHEQPNSEVKQDDSVNPSTAGTEIGPFGPILTQYRHDAQGAIKALTELQDGEAVAALNHPTIGDIDLVWGQQGTNKHDGFGLSKLVMWHPEVLSDLQNIVSSMQVTKQSENRVQLESDIHKESVRLQWNGESKHWLMTAFEKDERRGKASPSTDTTGNHRKDDSLPIASAHSLPPSFTNNNTQPAADSELQQGSSTRPIGWEKKYGAVKSVAESLGIALRNDSGKFKKLPELVAEIEAKDEAKTELNTAAHEAATSSQNNHPEPTEAQKEAGNYRKGHIRLNGHDISIENPAGTKRSPEWPPLQNHYGYIKGSVGADKDHVDVFLTDRAHDQDLPVFVVDQVNRDGSFDEHKVVMGAADEAEARQTYLSNYEEGWTGLGAITQMSQDEFKAWVRDPKKTKKPLDKKLSPQRQRDKAKPSKAQNGTDLAGEVPNASHPTAYSLSGRSVPLPVSMWIEVGAIANEVENRIGHFAHQPPILIRDTAIGFLPNATSDSHIAGAVHRGKIYLFRDELASLRDVKQTLFHELLHYGLRRFLTKEQFTEKMLDLYRRDRYLQSEADAFVTTPEGEAAAAFGGVDFALGRGVDEALARIAEPNQGQFLRTTPGAVLIRKVTTWLARLAEWAGFPEVAARLRGKKNAEARSYIQSVFQKLREDAPATSGDWAFTATPSFSRTKEVTNKTVSQWQASLRNATTNPQAKEPSMVTPTVLRAMGAKATKLVLSRTYLRAIKEKHPDVPDDVFQNLPAMLADPLFIVAHKHGGLRVFVRAETAQGEPIAVGVSVTTEGRINTVTPLHNQSDMTGPERMAQAVAMATGRIYAKNKEALKQVRASAEAAPGTIPLHRSSSSRTSLITRNDVVKKIDAAHDTGSAAFSLAGDSTATANQPGTSISTIRQSLTQAYGKLVDQLEQRGLITLSQTQEQAIEAAAQVRAEVTGVSVEQAKAELMASVKKSAAMRLWIGSRTVNDAVIPETPEYKGNTTGDLAHVPTGAKIPAGPLRVTVGYAPAPHRGRGITHMADNAQRNFKRMPVNQTGDLTEDLMREAVAVMAGVTQTHNDGSYIFVNPRMKKAIVANYIGNFYSIVSVRPYNSDTTALWGTPEWRGRLTFPSRETATASPSTTEHQDKLSHPGRAGLEVHSEKFDVTSEGEKQQAASMAATKGQRTIDIKRSANGAVQGFFDPQTGQSFLIADNLSAEAAPGVLMHEVGIHMAADGSMAKLFNRAKMLLKAQKGNTFMQGVQAKLDAAGETSAEEVAAYMVEAYENDRTKAPASVTKWLADMLAAVKAWLHNKGILGADSLSVADIAAVARANAKSMARGQPRKSNSTTTDSNTSFSRPDPFGSMGMSGFLSIMNAPVQGVSEQLKQEAVANVRATVDAIRATWGNAPEVEVVFDMHDTAIPQEARDADLRQRSRGATGDPEGFYFKGKVYLLASRLLQGADASRVLLHEALGHHGLHGVFGDSLSPILSQIATMRPREVADKAVAYGLYDRSKLQGADPKQVSPAQILEAMSPRQRQEAAEEVLAEMAQDTPELGFVRRAVAAIRTWLRKHVPMMDALALTDEEIINSFILPARRFVDFAAESSSWNATIRKAFSPTFSMMGDAGKRALAEFAKTDDLFTLPKSTKDTLEGIVADNDARFIVSKPMNIGGRLDYTIAMPDGTKATVSVRDPDPYGRDQIYDTIYTDDGIELVFVRPGENPEDVPPTGDVWIDVSALKKGDFGALMYNIAATYAHNTGRIFIGDPHGLSKDALRRRLEHMISSALKFGTTAHLAPHPDQTRGGHGVPPLRWVYGDDVGNVERMIAVSVQALDNGFPQSKLIEYRADGNFYNAKTGVPISRGGLAVRVAGAIGALRGTPGGDGGTGQAGWRTVARAALFRYLQSAIGDASSTISERGSILARAGSHVSRLDRGETGNGPFVEKERIFYSRRVSNGLTNEAVSNSGKFDLQKPDIHFSHPPQWQDVQERSEHAFSHGNTSQNPNVNWIVSADQSAASLVASAIRASMKNKPGTYDYTIVEPEYKGSSLGNRSGIVSKDLTDALHRRVREFETAFGRRVVFVQADRGSPSFFNGFILPKSDPTTIYVNADADVNLMSILGHEFYEGLVVTNPTLHSWFLNQAALLLNSGALQTYFNKLTALGDQQNSIGQFKELLADFTGDALADPEFRRSLEQIDKNKFRELIRSFRRFLIHFLGKMRTRITGTGLMGDKTLESNQYFRDIQALRDALREVILKSNSARALTTFLEGGGVMFSRTSQWQEAQEHPEPAPATWQTPETGRWDEATYNFQDRHIDTKRVQQAIEAENGALADGMNVRQREELFYGRDAKEVQDFKAKELNPMLEQLGKDGIELAAFEEYLHARHAPEANKVMAERNPNQEMINAGRAQTAQEISALAQLQTKLLKLSPELGAALQAEADKVLGKNTPNPAPWRAKIAGTPEGDWHDVAFVNAPQWLKDAVAKRGALLGGVVQQKGIAKYYLDTDQINMGSLNKNSVADQGTWRHEYGHAMDKQMQIGHPLRSTAPDFTDAMVEDAHELVVLGGHGPKSHKVTQAAIAKLQAAYAGSAQELLQASDKAQWLADRYAKNGLDFSQVQAAMKAQTDFATYLQGADLDGRYARIITAIEQRDAQGLMDALTGGWGNTRAEQQEARITYNIGNVGNLSDLFGSATSNQVSGRNKSGFGHEDTYYNDLLTGPTECFANLTCFYGDASPVWGQIIEAMTPRMAQLFKEIMK